MCPWLMASIDMYMELGTYMYVDLVYGDHKTWTHPSNAWDIDNDVSIQYSQGTTHN